MLESPLDFFRGAAYLMASDLAGQPRTGMHVQLCGDAHMSNFGYYAAPDRQIVFDSNDFDETLPGPFEWDLKRLVASFAVVGRERGFGRSARRAICKAVSRAYREAMAEFAALRQMEVWYQRTVVEDGFFEEFRSTVGKKVVKRAEKNVEKARRKDHLRAFSKLTEMVDGEPRLVSDPPLIMRLEDLATDEQAVTIPHDIIREYRRSLRPDSPCALRPLPLRRCGPQGGRGRLGRHPVLDHAPRRARQRRSPQPAAQGGAGVGPRAVPRQERVHKSRPARRGRPATDAGNERPHARVGPSRGSPGREARFLRPSALGREGLGAHRQSQSRRR
jgi:hypothetical protein